MNTERQSIEAGRDAAAVVSRMFDAEWARIAQKRVLAMYPRHYLSRGQGVVARAVASVNVKGKP